MPIVNTSTGPTGVLPIYGMATSNDPIAITGFPTTNVPLVSQATVNSTGLSPNDLAAIQADLYQLPGGSSPLDMPVGSLQANALLNAPGVLATDPFTQFMNFISTNILWIGIGIGGLLLFKGRR